MIMTMKIMALMMMTKMQMMLMIVITMTMMTHLLCRPSTPVPFLSRVAEVAKMVATQCHPNKPDKDEHKTELRAKKVQQR